MYFGSVFYGLVVIVLFLIKNVINK